MFIDDECIELFLKHDAWLVPTLIAPVALVEAIDRGMAVTDEIDRKARSIAATHLDAVGRAHEAGVRIAMGTDSGVFAHGSSPRELEWLVQAGLSALEALKAATSSGAELLGLEDKGCIRAGAVADLVVLKNHDLDLSRFSHDLANRHQGRPGPCEQRQRR